MAITYEVIPGASREDVIVRVDGKYTGKIRRQGSHTGDWRYWPQGAMRVAQAGEAFPTLAACKASLEEPEREPEPTYEQMKAMQDAERAIHQWWIMISEKERRDMVAGIPGCYTYGAVNMLQRLPAPAQDKVREAYARHLIHVAELEAAHPAD
jgi:hypothetical protein